MKVPLSRHFAINILPLTSCSQLETLLLCLDATPTMSWFLTQQSRFASWASLRVCESAGLLGRHLRPILADKDLRRVAL